MKGDAPAPLIVDARLVAGLTAGTGGFVNAHLEGRIVVGQGTSGTCGNAWPVSTILANNGYIYGTGIELIDLYP